MTPANGDAARESGARDAWGARRRAFRSLHERGCFVIPNPWDEVPDYVAA
jgi:hypothetical protein